MSRKRLFRFLRLATFTTVVLVIALLTVLPAGITYIYIGALVDRPCGNRPTLLTDILTNADALESITFSPADDLTLDGWLAHGENGAGVIILPGAWGGRDTMIHEMEFLHQAGYTVMTYDTRSCANPPQRTTLGYAETDDLKAALDIMAEHIETDRIGVLGHSMGGATAIMLAAEDERVKALVATGNYADLAYDVRRDSDGQGLLERWTRGWIERWYEWRTGVALENVRPLNVIGDISPRPVFLIHGAREVGETRVGEQYEAANDPKLLWIVDNASHGGYYEAMPEEYIARVTTFFDQYLRSE